MTIEISGIQETCQHRIRNFPGATHGLSRRSVNWLPKKSASRATHCAQYECLTITRCRFAPGNGTTRISGFSGALFRKYPAPHNKTPRCTFARLLLPPNGAEAAFATASAARRKTLQIHAKWRACFIWHTNC
jgi:hypothetical protein